MAQDIYVDPQTGGYILMSNKLTYVDTVINKINILLDMRIGSYLYAPTDGNPLLDMEGPLSLTDVSQAITTCLHPLIQSQEITNVLILNLQGNKILSNKYIINMAVTLPNGNQPLISWKT